MAMTQCVRILLGFSFVLSVASFVPHRPLNSAPGRLLRLQTEYKREPLLASKLRNIFNRKNNDIEDGDDHNVGGSDDAYVKPIILESVNGESNEETDDIAHAGTKPKAWSINFQSNDDEVIVDTMNSTSTEQEVPEEVDSHSKSDPETAVASTIPESEKNVETFSYTSTKREHVTNNPLVIRLDRVGESFHRRAQRASTSKYLQENKVKKFLFGLKSYAFYSLHLNYHGVRSFLTILPRLYRRVFRKMKMAVDDCNNDFIHAKGVGSTHDGIVQTKLQREREDEGKEVSPTKDSRYIALTTRLTVLVVASVITSSYILSGVTQIAIRFFKTLAKYTSLTAAFEAAADQATINEDSWQGVLRTANEE